MDKIEITEYLSKEFIPKIEENIKIQKEFLEQENTKNKELYEKAKECIIELIEYYADQHIPYDYNDIDDEILLAIESFIITTQTDPNYGIEIKRGVIDEDDYNIEELKAECSGFDAVYKYINIMWEDYKKTNNVFKSIRRILSHYVFSGNDEFCTFSKDVGNCNSEESQKYLLKEYTINDYKEVVNDFDEIMDYIKNQTWFEEDQVIGLLYIISGIEKPNNKDINLKEEKDLEALNEIVKIIDTLK